MDFLKNVLVGFVGIAAIIGVVYLMVVFEVLLFILVVSLVSFAGIFVCHDFGKQILSDIREDDIVYEWPEDDYIPIDEWSEK